MIEFSTYYLYLAAVWGVVFLIQFFLKKYRAIDSINHFVHLAVFGFLCLGFSVGVLVGNSRDSVTNAAISSILTFLGLFVIHVFEKNNDELKIISLIAIIVLPMSLLFGVFSGSINRHKYEVEMMDLKQWYEKGIELYKADLDIYKSAEKSKYSIPSTDKSDK